MASICLVLTQTTSSSETNQGNGNRPSSYYDNFLDNSQRSSQVNSDGKESSNRNSKYESPTQTHCLVTTVPQNITVQNIGGKHTPTRNSLRHSRMIVLNRNGRIPHKYLPAIIKYNKLAKALKGFVTLFGTALCFLSAWLLIWAHGLKKRDNPSYSAVPALLSGIVGLVFVCCCPKEYPGMKRSYIVYTIKVTSIFLTIVTIAATLTACVFAIIHLTSLSSMSCGPPDNLNKTCVCQVDPQKETLLLIKSYRYDDLSCEEVDSILTILLIFSCSTNLLAGILETWYIYLHWASRYTYIYSKVETEDQTMTVFAEKS